MTLTVETNIGEVTSVIEWDPASACYFARDPRRPGCNSDGPSIEEAETNLDDARQLWDRAWFEAHLNQPMPEGRAQVARYFDAIEAEARADALAGLAAAVEGLPSGDVLGIHIESPGVGTSLFVDADATVEVVERAAVLVLLAEDAAPRAATEPCSRANHDETLDEAYRKGFRDGRDGDKAEAPR
jgi:predicted RNase H-like HicB family nuclease